MTSPEPRLCRRCKREVVREADMFDVFEQMHYVCFHYEFEHDPADPDDGCSAGGCPSAALRAVSGSGGDDVNLPFLEMRARAATPGPWTSSVEGRDHLSGDHVVLTQSIDLYPRVVLGGRDENPNWEADQDYVAAVNPEVVLALIERLRRAESQQ